MKHGISFWNATERERECGSVQIKNMRPTKYSTKHRGICCKKNIVLVVVAQLVEWLVPIPEVRGSNPIIGKILY